MAEIKAAQVKELRDKTGVGMMDAKRALVEADGDVQQAIDNLREKGATKAAKKSDRVAAEGLAGIYTAGNVASIVEVNSETDFVASNDKFKQLVNDIAKAINENKPATMEEALNIPMNDGTINDAITNLTAVIGEKITLRRFEVIEKDDSANFGSYLHNGGLIAALVTVEGSDAEVARQVAMQVAASNPEYLSREDVPADVVSHEEKVATEETLNEGKPENIVPRIVEGRMNKFFKEICLVDQPFIMDTDKSTGDFVKSKGGVILNMVRYEVGEGIEKKEDNFVDEVMSQIK